MNSPVVVLQSGYPQRVEVIVYAAILAAAVDTERHMYLVVAAVYYFDGTQDSVVPTLCFEKFPATAAAGDEVIS